MKDDRITKNDILAYIESGRSAAKPIQAKPIQTENTVEKVQQPKAEPKEMVKTVAPIPVSGEDEIIEMTRMGKLVAQHMVASIQTSAHVQSFVEVDVTNIVKWRERVKDQYFAREGEKITYTPIFAGSSQNNKTISNDQHFC